MGFRLSDLDFVTALNDKNKDFEVTFDYITSGEYKPWHEFKELTDQEKKEQIAFREQRRKEKAEAYVASHPDAKQRPNNYIQVPKTKLVFKEPEIAIEVAPVIEPQIDITFTEPVKPAKKEAKPKQVKQEVIEIDIVDEPVKVEKKP